MALGLANESMAGTPRQQRNSPLVTGLDAVLVLEMEDESVAVKRALGRRVDPLTGRAYHLEFDPPPAKEPGLADRLKVRCSARQQFNLLRVVAQA